MTTTRPAARLTIPLLIVMGLVGLPAALVGGLYWRATIQERNMARLEAELEVQRVQFESEIARLLGETRRAQFRILKSRIEDGQTFNTIRFVEFFNEDDETSYSLKTEFELPGNEIYIDAVLVRYDDEVVRAGRARNFALFRRAFTNVVSPEEGELLYDISLKRADLIASERVERPSVPASAGFVERFVRYMQDPALAKREGVRLVEGQANYVNPRPGYYYSIIQRATGGLLIEEHPIPPVLLEDSDGD